MKSLIFSLTILLFFITNQFSQVSEEWVASYGSQHISYNFSVSRIAKDSKGNIYVAGSYNRTKYLLIKYDVEGNQVWVRTYDGSEERAGTIVCGLVIDANDNIIISGELCHTQNEDTTNDNIVTISYDTDGIVNWTNIYIDNNHTGADDWGRNMTMDKESNFYIAGKQRYPGTNSRGIIIKINSNGEFVWDRFIENGAENMHIDLWHIGVDSDGKIYVVGEDLSPQGYNIIVAKYSTNGTQQWIEEYSGFLSSAVNGMYVNSSGEVFITGNINNPKDYVTLKYDSDGALQWDVVYNGSTNSTDCGSSVICDGSGNVYVTGTSIENDFFTYRTSLTTVKYASNGTQQWTSSYIYTSEFTGSSEGNTISLDDNGNIYVAGIRYTGTAHSQDFLLIKYSSSGTVQWDKTYDYNGGNDGHGDWADPMMINDENTVYVSFECEKGSTYPILRDIVTIKYSPSDDNVSLKSINISPERYSLYQNYPDPFNPSTTIKFGIPKSEVVKLVIYDILGREVKTLVNELRNPGTYEVNFDASALSSGVYFYKLETASFVETKRMLLVK